MLSVMRVVTGRNCFSLLSWLGVINPATQHGRMKKNNAQNMVHLIAQNDLQNIIEETRKEKSQKENLT